jgi:hypothetical protein
MSTPASAAPHSDPTGTVWRLTRDKGEMVAPVLILGPDGTIGGIEDAGARRWVVRDGRLVILDGDGVARLVFMGGDPATATRLVGGVAGPAPAGLAIERVALPCGLDAGLPPHAEMVSNLIDDTRGRKRDNLVILRAGASSLHREWARDLADADRNWDLCISWYDAADPDPSDAVEYLTIQRDVRKFAAFHQIFASRPDFWDYRQIWLPDDDLMVTRSAVNRLFEVCRRNRIELAQPALDDASHLTYPITRRDPRFALRFTNFVEVMCPLFSREALRTCIDGFRSTVSSWGLDAIWPSLVGVGGTRIAIVDDVTVTHTRPVGGLYDREAAFAEMNGMLKAYRKSLTPTVLGGLQAGCRI